MRTVEASPPLCPVFRTWVKEKHQTAQQKVSEVRTKTW